MISRLVQGRLYYGWYIAGVTFLILIVAAGIRSTPSVLIIPLEQEFGWNRATVALAVSINLALYGLCGPFAAAFMERYGIRRIILISLTIIGLCAGSTIFMQQPWQLYLLWGFGVGISTGSIAIVLSAIVANRWFVKRRGLVVGLLTASSATGQLIFLPLLATLVSNFGWRTASITTASAALLLIPVVAIFMRDRPKDVGLKPYGADPEVEDVIIRPTGNPFATAFGALRRGAKMRDFWLLAGSFFICGATTNGLIGTHLIPAAMDHDIPEVTAASLLAVIGIFDVIGTTCSGWLSDRLDNRWLLCWYYSLRGLSLLALPYVLGTSFFGLAAFVVFYGLDWVATVPPTVRLSADIFGKANVGIYFGWIMAAHQLGAATVAFLAGLLYTLLGSYQVSFMSAGLLCMVAAGLVIRIGRTNTSKGEKLRLYQPPKSKLRLAIKLVQKWRKLLSGLQGARWFKKFGRMQLAPTNYHLSLRPGIILVGVLLLIGLEWPGTPVLAHAGLVRSDPPDRCTALELPRLSPDDPGCATGALLTNPPTEIHLWFSEPVQPVRNSLVITAPSGKKIEVGQIELKGLELVVKLNAAEEGTYQVRWQVLSGDTHPVRGRFAFSVGRASPNLSGNAPTTTEVGAVSPLGLSLQIMGRWLHLCGYALAFGSLAFRWLVLRPLKLDGSEIIERRLWRLVGLGLVLLLLAEPLALLGQTASLGAELIFDPDVTGDVLASNFGRVLAQRLGVALLLWVLTGIAKQENAAIAALVALGLGLVLALVDGQASHAISSNPVVLTMAFNTVHVAAMGVWVGGLASLLVIWQLSRLEGRRKELVMRFGLVALVALALLIISGTGMAWLYLAQPGNLFTTNYGLALLLKIAVLVVVLLLAWFGRRVAASPSRHTRWWMAESLTLLALLVLAALLVALPPSA